MLFVYFIEADTQHAHRVKRIFATMERRGDVLCTSVFTIGEVLTGPYKKGAMSLVSEIRELIGAPLVELLPFRAETADHYARIRAGNRVSPADAIHLASAAEAGVNLFLTNDHRLQRVAVPGIDFIAGMDVNLF